MGSARLWNGDTYLRLPENRGIGVHPDGSCGRGWVASGVDRFKRLDPERLRGKWASAHVSSFWLVLQSLAVIVGGIGAWRSTSFVAAAVVVASSLIARTAVGHISFFPGLLMLFLIVTRFTAFSIFLPRLSWLSVKWRRGVLR
jgi:hypothetical protein